MKTASTELRENLLDSVKQQKLLQAKVTDLEGRSRHNDIRMYGIKGGTEESLMLTFMNIFLKTNLTLKSTVIYKSSDPTAWFEAIWRSILVHFQRYDIKDKKLKMAWSKKITCDRKPATFSWLPHRNQQQTQRILGYKDTTEKTDAFPDPVSRQDEDWLGKQTAPLQQSKRSIRGHDKERLQARPAANGRHQLATETHPRHALEQKGQRPGHSVFCWRGSELSTVSKYKCYLQSSRGN